MRRYQVIAHSERYGLLCIWDAREGTAVTVHQTLWLALKYEDI